MRDIKFRAWDNQNKQMLDVQELNFEDCFYGGEMQIRTTMYSDYFDCREMPLMQYTGLHDKNGKEIYEGDIVKCSFYPDFIFEIKFTELCWYMRKIPTSEHINLSDVLYEDLEVIGNIYDNPELLEEGE